MTSNILVLYLVVVNLIAFVLMGWDKRQAKRGAWRQSERSLFILAAIGGSFGVYFGSQFWRHKTQKKSFRRVFWGIIFIQILLLVGLGYSYY